MSLPKCLPLGKVTSVEKNPGSMYYTVVSSRTHTENAEEASLLRSLTVGRDLPRRCGS